MGKRYCVYFLKCTTTGNVVYIGSGTISRANLRSSRSKEFQEYCKQNKVITVVIRDDLTKNESLLLEQEYLDRYFNISTEGFNLFNLTGVVAKTKKYEYSVLSEVFYYDETSPTFLRWKVDRYGTGRAKIMKIHDVAGYIGAKNYMSVSLNYSMYLIHRIIYCLHTKQDVPTDLVIDHIDGDPINNKIENLRLVSQSTNMKNRLFDYMQSNNTSGITGVRKHKTQWNEYWAAHYKGDVKYFNIKKLGNDTAYEMAIKAREQMVLNNKE